MWAAQFQYAVTGLPTFRGALVPVCVCSEFLRWKKLGMRLRGRAVKSPVKDLAGWPGLFWGGTTAQRVRMEESTRAMRPVAMMTL